MKINKLKKYSFLLLISFFSFNASSNDQISSNFSQDFTSCLTVNEGDLNNWGENLNMESLNNCINNVIRGSGIGQENITSYSELEVNSDICEGGLFSTPLKSGSLSRVNSNSLPDLNNSCLFLLPNGNEDQELTMKNRNNSVNCRATFKCNNNNWNISNNIGNKNTQYCEESEHTITNPIYSAGELENYYLNTDIEFNNEGRKDIIVPRLAFNENQNDGQENSGTYRYSYSYGGYNITHTFTCNENLTVSEKEGSPSVSAIPACINTNDISNDMNFSISGFSEHPTENRRRSISCSLNARNQNDFSSSNPIRSNILSKINSQDLFIFEMETSGLNINESYGFFRNDELAIFRNNFNSARAVVGCTDNSGWRVLSGTCSNIRNSECFDVYSELNEEGTRNIRQSPISIRGGVLDFNPKKRRLPNGDFTEDYLIYNFVGRAGDNSFCFEYENLKHEY